MDCALNTSSWEAYGQSNICFSKEKNGDHLLLEDIRDEKTLIAIVSDGITNQPCDWLASELACNKFYEFFIKANSIPVRERIKESVRHANNNLLSVEDECRGLASTLTLVVWEYDRAYFYYVNIGDSRIYSVSDGNIIQLTRDDKVLAKMDVQTSEGLKDIWTVTSHLGREYPDIIIHEGTFGKGGFLLLASDGFFTSRKSSFEKNIIELSKSDNLQSDFNKLVRKFEILADDDMTAIVIRKVGRNTDN